MFPSLVADALATTFWTSRPPLVRLMTSVSEANDTATAVVVLLAMFRELMALPPDGTDSAVPVGRMFAVGLEETKETPS